MSAQHSEGWARDPIRGAGGRRHYNSLRRDMAIWRRGHIVRVVHESGTGMFARGSAARRFRPAVWAHYFAMGVDGCRSMSAQPKP
jgi:hypothetical protein